VALGILKRMGCTNVVTAEDGEAALEALHAAGGPDAFDVILMDLHMPRKVNMNRNKEIGGSSIGRMCKLTLTPPCPGLLLILILLPLSLGNQQGGMETVRDIRSTWTRYKTKIIAVTADAFEDTRDNCIAVGGLGG